jgi:hypothetical protein
MSRTLVAAALAIGVLAIAACPGRAEVFIESFDGCTIGNYSNSGGNELVGQGTLAGWNVGGRYFEIFDAGGGDLEYRSNGLGYSMVCVATDMAGPNYQWPVYEAAEALDLSKATYVKFNFSNDTTLPLYLDQGKPGGGTLQVWFYDDSAGATATVNLGRMTELGHPMPTGAGSLTYMLSGIAGFDPSVDRVYGFTINDPGLRGYRTEPSGLDPKVTLISITSDVPEPATMGLLALGVLPLARRPRRR